MTIAFAIAIYLIIWWMVLFAMLPIGVRTQAEEGRGRRRGPPKARRTVPQLLAKIVATTVVASVVFAVVYLIVAHHLITLDDIPFFPRFETIR